MNYTITVCTYGEHFDNVIAGGANGVHVTCAEGAVQRAAVGFKNPLLNGFEFAVLGGLDALLLVRLGQVHVHLGDGRNA